MSLSDTFSVTFICHRTLLSLRDMILSVVKFVLGFKAFTAANLFVFMLDFLSAPVSIFRIWKINVFLSLSLSLSLYSSRQSRLQLSL